MNPRFGTALSLGAFGLVAGALIVFALVAWSGERARQLTALNIPLDLHSKIIHTPSFTTSFATVYSITLRFSDVESENYPLAHRLCPFFAGRTTRSSIDVSWMLTRGKVVLARGAGPPKTCGLRENWVDIDIGTFDGVVGRRQELQLTFHRGPVPMAPRLIVAASSKSVDLGQLWFLGGCALLAVGSVVSAAAVIKRRPATSK